MVAVAVISIAATDASADGEDTPILGVNAIGGDQTIAPDQHAALGGLGLDLAVWHGRLGLAVESSARWAVAADTERELVLGASARVRVLEHMLPSLLDPRDVEVGLELQAIIERTWRNIEEPVDPNAYGVGIALRVRGSGDPDNDEFMSESRFFLRVMASKWSELDTLARTMMPTSPTERAITVLLGVGAAFGSGTPGYMNRFRLHHFEPF